MPHYFGHRQRLRERMIATGAESLADYELIELILFAARARGDVKPSDVREARRRIPSLQHDCIFQVSRAAATLAKDLVKDRAKDVP